MRHLRGFAPVGGGSEHAGRPRRAAPSPRRRRPTARRRLELTFNGPEATLGRRIATKTASNGCDNCHNEMLFSVLAAAHYNILPAGGRTNGPGMAWPGGRFPCPEPARPAVMARIGSLARLGLHGPAWLDGHCRLAGRFRPWQASGREPRAKAVRLQL